MLVKVKWLFFSLTNFIPANDPSFRHVKVWGICHTHNGVGYGGYPVTASTSSLKY